MSFSVQVIDRRRRFGQIEVGDFIERFEIAGKWELARFESEWRRQLNGLVARRRKGLLPTSATAGKVFCAWILYRDSRKLYVQQRYYVRHAFRYGRSRIHARQIRNEEGQKLSEWSVPLESVATFLKEGPTSR